MQFFHIRKKHTSIEHCKNGHKVIDDNQLYHHDLPLIEQPTEMRPCLYLYSQLHLSELWTCMMNGWVLSIMLGSFISWEASRANPTSKSICCLLEQFFEDYIFAWWNLWVSIILLLFARFKTGIGVSAFCQRARNSTGIKLLVFFQRTGTRPQKQNYSKARLSKP